jgi:Protein tyrosine and serine/threonine kinase
VRFIIVIIITGAFSRLCRNCLVGKGLQIKISDFGTDSDTYAMDYYRSDGQLLGLPIRWMAWESVIQVSRFQRS